VTAFVPVQNKEEKQKLEVTVAPTAGWISSGDSAQQLA